MNSPIKAHKELSEAVKNLIHIKSLIHFRKTQRKSLSRDEMSVICKLIDITSDNLIEAQQNIELSPLAKVITYLS